MSVLQNLFGNATAVDLSKVQAEFTPIFIENETVSQAFKLFRDLLVLTNYRLIVVDKQGLTGSKQDIASIPWKSIKKFSCETSGFLDGDGELKVWMNGEAAPMKWELSAKVNIREVCRHLSHFVLTR